MPDAISSNVTPGVTDMTSAIQSQVDSGSKLIVLAPVDYLISDSIRINRDDITISGAGARIVSTTELSGALIEIGAGSDVENITVDGVSLVGNGNNSGGIKIGSFSNYAAFVHLNKVRITGLTGNASYGIGLYRCQEVDIEKCYVIGNFYNYYRPDGGSCTSTCIHGVSGYVGHAIDKCVYLVGITSDLRFRNIVFESNRKEVIYCNTTNTVGRNVLQIRDCYFEDNGPEEGSLPNIFVTSRPEVSIYNRQRVHITDCFWGTIKNNAQASVELDYVFGSSITNNTHINIGLGVLITENSDVLQENNK